MGAEGIGQPVGRLVLLLVVGGSEGRACLLFIDLFLQLLKLRSLLLMLQEIWADVLIAVYIENGVPQAFHVVCWLQPGECSTCRSLRLLVRQG